jgi:ABC-type oligopeptide transport system ATPase subunit
MMELRMNLEVHLEKPCLETVITQNPQHQFTSFLIDATPFISPYLKAKKSKSPLFS